MNLKQHFIKYFLIILVFAIAGLVLSLLFQIKEEFLQIKSFKEGRLLNGGVISYDYSKVKQYPEKREVSGETESSEWQEVAKIEPLDDNKEITIDSLKWCVERTEEYGCSCARLLVDYSEGNSYLSSVIIAGGNQIKCREVNYNPLYNGMIEKISLECASGDPICGSHCGSQALTKGSLYLTGFEVQ